MHKIVFGAAFALSLAFAHSSFAANTTSYISLEEFLEVRDLSSMTLSPDSKSVAVRVSHDDVTSNRRIEEWYAVSLGPTPQAKRIADAGEPDVHRNGPAVGPVSMEPPTWSQDSKWIYYLAIRDAQVQVWRTEASGGRTEQLTRDDADVERFVLDPKTDTLLYAVRATRAEIEAAERDLYRDGVLLDDTLDAGEQVVRNHLVNGRLMTYRRVNGPRAVIGYSVLLGDREEKVKALDLTSGRSADASAAQLALYRSLTEGWDSPISPSLELKSGSGSVVIAADEMKPATGSATERIRFRPADSAARELVCKHIACSSTDSRLGFNAVRSLSLVGWLADSSLVFRKEEFHGEGLYLWDIKKQRVRRVIFTEGLLTGTSRGYGRCLLAGNEAICAVANADRAPRLEAIALRSGQSRVLLDPNPHMGPARLGRTERLIVSTTEKDLTYGFLVLPREYEPGKPLPLVITDYSCDGFIRPEDDVSEHVLAAAGIASFCLNDNFGAQRPKAAAAGVVAVGVRTGMEMQASMAFRTAVVEQLAQRGLVDPKRVALAGMSGGATQVSYVLSRSDAFVAGMITTASYDDPMNYYLNGASVRLHFKDASGRPVAFEDYLASVSPALSPQGMEPLLMQVPDREYTTNMQLFTAMAAHGRAVEMIIYPDEFHVKVQPQHRLSAYGRSHDWFRFWLQGYEDPDVRKRAQYERWRILRQKNDTGRSGAR